MASSILFYSLTTIAGALLAAEVYVRGYASKNGQD
jgi:hypothetical protein